MFNFAAISRQLRFILFAFVTLFVSIFTFAQVTLTHRVLTGYLLNSDASVSKTKPNLLLFEQADHFEQVFQSATTKRPEPVNFTKNMVVGVVLAPTAKPPKLSISKVFVQDSVLTVRYIRMADTALAQHPLATSIRPVILLSIPKHDILKTKLVENGKVVQIRSKSVSE